MTYLYGRDYSASGKCRVQEPGIRNRELRPILGVDLCTADFGCVHNFRIMESRFLHSSFFFRAKIIPIIAITDNGRINDGEDCDAE